MIRDIYRPAYRALDARLSPDDGGDPHDLSYLFQGGRVGGVYDPSDLSTLFQDSAQTVPVTATGQLVWVIRDKSGLNNHLTAPSDAARPVFRQLGAARLLDFDGINDQMTSASGFTLANPWSFMGVGDVLPGDGASPSLIMGLTINSTNFMHSGIRASNQRVYGTSRLAASSVNASQVVEPMDQPGRGPGVFGAIFTNGNIAIHSKGAVYTGTQNLTTESGAGGSLRIGGMVASTIYSPMHFYGGVMIDDALAGDRLTDVTGWLNTLFEASV